MSISDLFNLGRTSLQVNQYALQVTSHNIANVNTPGYSRQQLVVETGHPFDTSAGSIGSGVRGQEVKRVYDRFLSYQMKGEEEEYGRLSEEKDLIARVEDIFNELSNSGIRDRLAEFFNSLKELSNNAGSYSERSQVLAKADTLTQTIRNKASDLKSLQNNIDTGIKDAIGDVNTIIAQIADLNVKISDMESAGSNANDFRDKRDALMSDLSELIDYDYFEDSTGQVAISVGKGNMLVEGKNYNALSDITNDSNFTDIEISNGSLTTNITSDISDGRLKGLLNVRDGDIAGFLDKLNTFAKAIKDEFNTQHEAGYDLNSAAGGQFFDATAGDEAATISLLITDTDQIAAASSSAGGSADNRNALLLAGIQDKTMPSLSTTLDSYYSGIVADVGTRSQLASRNFGYQNFSKEQLESRIEAIAGVSLDEEAANLIKFQRAFEASAKLITTADEMMQTILELKR